MPVWAETAGTHNGLTSKLQLKHDESDEGGATCPSCGAAMAEGAVLCVACGYDTRTGRRADDVPPPRQNPLLLAALALVILAAGAYVVLRGMGNKDSALPPPAAKTTAKAKPAPAPAPVAAPTNKVAAAAPTATVAAVASTVETNVPTAPVVDVAAIEAAQRQLAEAQLDKVAPLYEAGEAVELRMTNGLVQRGKFKVRTDEFIVVEVSSNEVRQISLLALDRGTRVRSDPNFRDDYLDFHARQRALELVKAAAAK